MPKPKISGAPNSTPPDLQTKAAVPAPPVVSANGKDKLPKR